MNTMNFLKTVPSLVAAGLTCAAPDCDTKLPGLRGDKQSIQTFRWVCSRDCYTSKFFDQDDTLEVPVGEFPPYPQYLRDSLGHKKEGPEGPSDLV